MQDEPNVNWGIIKQNLFIEYSTKTHSNSWIMNKTTL